MTEYLKILFPTLSELALKDIKSHAYTANFKSFDVIFKPGDYIKVVPIVISGLVKVFTQNKDKELLLYYIKPQQSCIMSFNAGMNNIPLQVMATAETDTELILLPTRYLKQWTKSYPELNTLFYDLYNIRYLDLLDSINHLIFDKLDVRLYDYLIQKIKLTQQNPLQYSHRQIAEELGTAREVISRLLKKIESEKLIELSDKGIKIIGL